MDILYSADIPSNEVASNIFYFPKPSDVLEYSDIEDDPLVRSVTVYVVCIDDVKNIYSSFCGVQQPAE